MNKIVNINLGGYPFTIDDDAYDYLKQYLASIRSHFDNSEGRDEIVSDIEDRLAELFQENLEGRPILTIKEVEAAVKTMGMPEEFDEEGTEDQPMSSGKKFSRTGKKLFRNTDNKVLGGVCSGISAYFGIEDPVWIRVAVAISFFMGGMGFLPYVILWVILPEAKTSADKLAMKGEPINVSNIAKTVEDEINHITKKFSELSEELQAKYGKEKKKEPSEEEGGEKESDDEGDNYKFVAGQYVDQGFEVVGAVVFNIGKFFRSSGKTIIFIVCAALIFTIAASWIGLITGFTFIFPYESYFVNSPITAFLGLSSLLMLIGIPVLFVVFALMKMVFRTRLSTYWGLALWGIWVVAFGALMVIGSNMTKEFNEEASIEENIMLNVDDQSIMKLSLNEGDYDEIITNFGPLVLTDGKLLTDHIHYNISKSESDKFELTKVRTSRGRNQDLATRYAHAANYTIDVLENSIVFPSHFSIDRGHKWRVQEISFDLKVPEGRSIEFDRGLAHRINRVFTAEKLWHHELSNKTLTMTEEGLICANCNDDEEHELIEEIEAVGDIETVIEKAEEAIEKVEKEIEKVIEKIETDISQE